MPLAGSAIGLAEAPSKGKNDQWSEVITQQVSGQVKEIFIFIFVFFGASGLFRKSKTKITPGI